MNAIYRSSPFEKWRKADVSWLFAVLLIGLAARLFRIESQPYWLDEVLTFRRVHLGMSGLIADSFTNRHMPSYFMILNLVSAFGSGSFWLRLPSALFGALSAGVIFIIGRRIGGRPAALVAGLLMALSPQQVQYGQEARSYTLETLLITVALWGLVRLAQNPARAALDWRDQASDRWGWAAYAGGTVGALDVLSDAAPWLIVANVSLLLVWRGLRTTEGRALGAGFGRNWALSAGLVALLCLPFYGAILAASDGHMLQKFNWIPKLSWQHLWVTASSAYLMRMSTVVRFDLVPTMVPVLGPLVGALGVLGLWHWRHRLEGRILMLGFSTLPLLLLACSLVKPMLLPRYILWSAAPFFVLAGLGAAAMPKRALPATVVGLMLLGAVNLTSVYQVETKPRWDLAAATLAANVRPGDTVYTSDPNASAMLAVLQPKDAMPIETTALVTQRLDLAVARWKQGGRVWAVHGRSALGEREELDVFKAHIAALGTPSRQIAQGEEITILMFPAPATP